MEVLAISLEKE